MKILAIDQSTTASGTCLYRPDIDDGVALLNVYKTPYKLKGEAALEFQSSSLYRLIALVRPDALVIESVHLGRGNPHTVFILGRLYERLTNAARMCGIPQTITIAPATATAYMGLKLRTPSADKKRAARQLAAQKIYGHRGKWLNVNEHEADAYILALCGLAEYEARLVSQSLTSIIEPAPEL